MKLVAAAVAVVLLPAQQRLVLADQRLSSAQVAAKTITVATHPHSVRLLSAAALVGDILQVAQQIQAAMAGLVAAVVQPFFLLLSLAVQAHQVKVITAVLLTFLPQVVVVVVLALLAIKLSVLCLVALMAEQVMVAQVLLTHTELDLTNTMLVVVVVLVLLALVRDLAALAAVAVVGVMSPVVAALPTQAAAAVAVDAQDVMTRLVQAQAAAAALASS